MQNTILTNSEKHTTNQIPLPNINKETLRNVALKFKESQKEFEVCKDNLNNLILEFDTAIHNCKPTFEQSHGLKFKEVNNKLTTAAEAYTEDTLSFVHAIQNYGINPDQILPYIVEFPIHHQVYCQQVNDFNEIITQFTETNPECFT